MTRAYWLTLLGCLCAFLTSTTPTSIQAEPEGAFITRFDSRGALEEGWQISHHAIKAPHIRTAYRRQSVLRSEDGAIELTLQPAPTESEKEFHGAEIQRKRRTHFGRYEVVMTAARGYGVISSFFTYTGPFYGDDHDEIDFEFLGRDTTKVWVTRFAKGERLPGEWVELGFDAADAPHLYTFDWLPDRIVWFADGQEIFRVEAEDRTLPDIPGRVMISLWAGGEAQANWSGTAPADMATRARYHCISYRPPESTAPMCSDE